MEYHTYMNECSINFIVANFRKTGQNARLTEKLVSLFRNKWTGVVRTRGMHVSQYGCMFYFEIVENPAFIFTYLSLKNYALGCIFSELN